MNREAACGGKEARTRARIARTYLDLAGVASASHGDETRNAAAGNAVLAAIAASDSLCCLRLGRRSRGSDHAVATTLLAKITPGGSVLARDLAAALAVKDAAHYGTTFLTEAKLRAAMRAATRLVEAAESAQSAG
jgi:hypothetical protein